MTPVAQGWGRNWILLMLDLNEREIPSQQQTTGLVVTVVGRPSGVLPPTASDQPPGILLYPLQQNEMAMYASVS